MPQIQGVIEQVQGRPLQNGNTIYDVLIGGQKYSTFKAELARQANALVGQQALINVSTKMSQDGMQTFYNFDGVADGAGLPGQIPMAQGTPMAQQLPVQQGIPMAAPASGGMNPEREARIVKQSSMATAFNFVGHLFDGAGPEAMEQAEGLALALAKRLYVQVLGAPQTLDDEIVEGLVAQAPPPEAQAPESW